METPAPLIAPTFVFRFAVPCYELEHWDLKDSTEMELPAGCIIPSFGELDGRPVFGDLRIGWNREGLAISLRVVGKKQPPWCRATRSHESDGLSLLIDTRPSGEIHRATRFCHHFVLMPQGGGKKEDQPYVELMEIARAKESPKPIAADAIRVRAEKRIDGYLLRAAIPARVMTGFAPDEASRLGFAYVVKDRELGWQTLSIGGEYPILSDPSLWGTMELVSEPPPTGT